GRGLEIDAEKIAYGVVVLGAVEAADRYLPRIARAGAVAEAQGVVDEIGERRDLQLRGLGLVVWRHAAAGKLLGDGFPGLAIGLDLGEAAEFVEGDIALVLAVAVAGEAILLHQGLDLVEEALVELLGGGADRSRTRGGGDDLRWVIGSGQRRKNRKD